MEVIIIKKLIMIFSLFIIFVFLTGLLYYSKLNLNTDEAAIGTLKIENNKLKDDNTKLKKELIQLQANNNTLSSKLAERQSASKQNTSKADTESHKVAYLTFDDGPSVNTLSVLKILKTNNIHAVFFVNGRPEYSYIYRQIVEQGNEIGNHTYSHEYNEVYASADSYNNDVERLNNFLSSLGISRPIFMRFPGGSNNTVSYKYGGKNLMTELISEENSKGYIYVDWNVDSGDADKVTEPKEYILNKVKNEAKGQDSIIILFHDAPAKTTTVEALPEVIDYLKAQGYTFELLSKNSPLVHFK